MKDFRKKRPNRLYDDKCRLDNITIDDECRQLINGEFSTVGGEVPSWYTSARPNTVLPWPNNFVESWGALLLEPSSGFYSALWGQVRIATANHSAPAHAPDL
jgi:hypothetical protein